MKYMLYVLILAAMIAGCGDSYLPKPRGYFRIELPEKKYRVFDTTFPYAFEYPSYALIKPAQHAGDNPYWMDIEFPRFRATIYLSYKPVVKNLRTLTEDSRTFVMKHIPRATSIDESTVEDPSRKVYGTLWYIKGQETASPCQFFLTDSTHHFLRGALYFNVRPNNDSLQPVIEFITADIEHMARTLRWKNR
ncbi:MAG: gliding motility lipoprotein GldD [Bacteroidales bacterium]